MGGGWTWQRVLFLARAEEIHLLKDGVFQIKEPQTPATTRSPSSALLPIFWGRVPLLKSTTPSSNHSTGGPRQPLPAQAPHFPALNRGTQGGVHFRFDSVCKFTWRRFIYKLVNET